tara:strand:+ start:1436 stop:1948 length:513 start_codon:yes stop_codon:yes gene_type:complete
MNNRKEVKRENKQVRKLKKLRSLDAKGKITTDRYKKLKQKVYNPFIDTRKDMKKMGAAMGKVKNPIPKYDPTEGVKKGVDKNIKTKTSMRVGKPIKKEELDRKMYEHSYKAQNRNTGAIKMTAAPHEYLLGGGVAKGGFNLSKSLVEKVVTKAKPILKNAATDFGIDQAL